MSIEVPNGVLKEGLKGLCRLSDGVVSTVEGDSFELYAVDSANTSMASLDLSWYYDGDEESDFGFKASDVQEDLRECEDGTTVFDFDQETVQTELRTHEKTEVRRIKDTLGDVEYECVVEIDRKELKRVYRASDLVTDHIIFGVVPSGMNGEGELALQMYADGDIDSVYSYPPFTFVEDASEQFYSIYTLPLLKELVYGMPASVDALQLSLGSEIPMRARFDIQRHASVEWHIAPRIVGPDTSIDPLSCFEDFEVNRLARNDNRRTEQAGAW